MKCLRRHADSTIIVATSVHVLCPTVGGIVLQMDLLWPETLATEASLLEDLALGPVYKLSTNT